MIALPCRGKPCCTSTTIALPCCGKALSGLGTGDLRPSEATPGSAVRQVLCEELVDSLYVITCQVTPISHSSRLSCSLSSDSIV